MAVSQPAPKSPTGVVQPLWSVAHDLRNNLQRLAQRRGWPYAVAWAHRIAGVLLVVYAGVHILTLSVLHQPERFAAQMRFFGFSLFVVLEWGLALPVIFHALNGGRLVLYEAFGNRRDDLLIRWVAVLSAVYLLLLGLVMVAGNQAVSAAFFWLYTVAASIGVTVIALSKIRRSGAGVLWKLQRITGAYLLLMVPAHMLFMHLNPSVGRDAEMIISRMRNPLMKLVDLTLVLSVFYHGAYGLFSICQDYLPAGRTRIACGALIMGIMAWLSWVGIRLTITI